MRWREVVWSSDEERQLFLQEIEELLDQLEQSALSADPDVSAAFRAAHTIKGGAAMVGLDAWVAIAHQVEDRMDQVRQGRLPFSEVRDGMLAMVDDIRRDLSGEDAQPPRGEPGGLRVRVVFNADTLMPGVRAYQVLTAMAEWGQIKASSPNLGEVEAWVGRMLEATLASDRPPADIARALEAVPDVEEVSCLLDAGETDPSSALPKTKDSAPSPARRDQTIRIQAEVLETLLEGLGELLLRQAQLVHQVKGGQLSPYALSDGLDRIKRIAIDLQDTTLRARMLPLDTLFRQYPRAVHDLSRKLGKPIRLEIAGAETELDRLVMDSLHEPLLHLIRNACDHGIEDAPVREMRGKPREGTLSLSASTSQGHVHIVLEDDGGGIDWEALRRRAVERGVLSAEEARVAGHDQLTPVLFLPGVSTARTVSDLSGRGVGLDAVKSVMDQLHGAISVESTEGKGTRFHLELPMTMAILSALLVQVGETVVGLPIAAVDRIESLAEVQIESPLGQEIMDNDAYPLPVFSLDRVLDVASRGPDILIRVMDGPIHVGLAVDSVIGQQEVVVKPVERLLPFTPWLTGTAVLGDGRLAFMTDIKRLLATVTADEREVRGARAGGGETAYETASVAWLVFELSDRQLYAINIHKVREVLPVQPVTRIPHSHAWVAGVTRVRDQTFPVVDLNRVLGLPATADTGYVIVTEMSHAVQAVWVSRVVQIIEGSWKDLLPIDDQFHRESAELLTGLIHHAIGTIQLLDLEFILSAVRAPDPNARSAPPSAGKPRQWPDRVVWLADDSRFARERVIQELSQLGCRWRAFVDGDALWEALAEAETLPDLVISDVEMPRMDGYSLTERIKRHPRFREIAVVVHTSLSGELQTERARRVGADRILTKWDPPAMMAAVGDLLAAGQVAVGAAAPSS